MQYENLLERLRQENFHFRGLILKLASRCNLKCTYCYWFRDDSVYSKPKIIAPAVVDAFISKLENHILKFKLKSFGITFHGGEPLLYGFPRFKALLERIERVARETKCSIDMVVVTNGILLNSAWIALLRNHQVGLTISLDPTPAAHDRYRVNAKGKGSYAAVREKLKLTLDNGYVPGILTVADTNESPQAIFDHFFHDLGLKSFDVLMPDATHDDNDVSSIAPFYCSLFDLWYDVYASKGVEIRFFKSMVQLFLGLRSRASNVGYAPLTDLVVNTDGSIEPLDVLRIAGSGHNETGVNVMNNAFQDGVTIPLWLEALEASINLPAKCNGCEFKLVCGGGYIAHRWSSARRYGQPSVYCKQLQEVFGHIKQRLEADLVVTI